MKKILLIITITLCIFQMVVLATAIDIGSPAIGRDGQTTTAFTYVGRTNPANATGTITEVKIWCAGVGVVLAGSEQTFTVDIDVVEGDFLGITNTAGNVERGDSGVGYNWTSGDHIPADEVSFSYTATREISLGGTGTTEEEAEDNAIWFGIIF